MLAPSCSAFQLHLSREAILLTPLLSQTLARTARTNPNSCFATQSMDSILLILLPKHLCIIRPVQFASATVVGGVSGSCGLHAPYFAANSKLRLVATSCLLACLLPSTFIVFSIYACISPSVTCVRLLTYQQSHLLTDLLTGQIWTYRTGIIRRHTNLPTSHVSSYCNAYISAVRRT